MKYRVEIAYTIEAEGRREAAMRVQGQLDNGLPQHFALAIRPVDEEGNPKWWIRRGVDARARVWALEMEAREMEAYRKGRDENDAYRDKMEELEKLMTMTPEAPAGSPEGERLRELAAQIEEYEQEHYPLGPVGRDVCLVTLPEGGHCGLKPDHQGPHAPRRRRGP